MDDALAFERVQQDTYNPNFALNQCRHGDCCRPDSARSQRTQHPVAARHSSRPGVASNAATRIVAPWATCIVCSPSGVTGGESAKSSNTLIAISRAEPASTHPTPAETNAVHRTGQYAPISAVTTRTNPAWFPPAASTTLERPVGRDETYSNSAAFAGGTNITERVGETPPAAVPTPPIRVTEAVKIPRADAAASAPSRSHASTMAIVSSPLSRSAPLICHRDTLEVAIPSPSSATDRVLRPGKASGKIASQRPRTIAAKALSDPKFLTVTSIVGPRLVSGGPSSNPQALRGSATPIPKPATPVRVRTCATQREPGAAHRSNDPGVPTIQASARAPKRTHCDGWVGREQVS